MCQCPEHRDGALEGANASVPAKPTRRRFVQSTAAALGAAALPLRLPAEARAAIPKRRSLSNPVFVVLFQRGGADCLQLFAPTGDPNYAVLRPTVGIGAPGSSNPVQGLFMNSLFSMHPSMSGIHALYGAAQSRLAVVHATGYLPYHRSHFESQDLMETGSFAGLASDGWINRHLQATAGSSSAPVRALALRQSLPRSMDGPFPCFAVNSVADLAFQGSLPDVRQTLEYIVDVTPTSSMSPERQGFYTGMTDAFDLIDLFAGIDPSSYVPQNGAAYPATDLGNRMKELAQVIRADLGIEIFQVDQGGWDHHTNLPANVPVYAGDLSAALSAFIQDLGPLMNDVVFMAYSEFGREAGQNGSGGSDHGAGGSIIVAGGNVLGGQVHGVWPGISTAQLAQGRFLMPANDYRNVIVEILQDHLGGTVPQTVFSNWTYAPLGLI